MFADGGYTQAAPVVCAREVGRRRDGYGHGTWRWVKEEGGRRSIATLRGVQDVLECRSGRGDESAGRDGVIVGRKGDERVSPSDVHVCGNPTVEKKNEPEARTRCG